MHIEAVDISPIEAFLRLRSLPFPFIISGTRARYSYVSARPFITVRTEDGSTFVEGEMEGKKRFDDPFAALSHLLKSSAYTGGSPFPFSSGAAGYFSYDLNNLIEPKLKAKRAAGRGLGLPDCLLGLYDPVFVYDNAEGKGHLVSRRLDKARFGGFKRALEARSRRPSEPGPVSAMTSNFTREGYIAAIEKAKEYISSGDIYQINLSQRLGLKWEGDPFAIFLKMQDARPAPFSSYFDFGGFQIISNSPERLVKIEGGHIETEPIKGTRPRGVTPEEDEALREGLRMSAKERAEHVMIVDLERNDLGRISLPGTVNVNGFGEITTYPTLHHMASIVKGQLRPEIDTPQALKAVFPGGSVTGAPKIRAMEIIDELEPDRRGVYTGGIGWMDLNGDIDMAMAIRTAVYKDNTIYLHVGGGIVADSVPADEYDETLLKARDFLDILKLGARAI
ncbi:MAG: aminodeoxychorismate synthase component I [Deltaproteobacteria bacterium]|nr:aminodeoxychorismate synthase component I [Deltaproteobacteria bacterium]